MQHTILVEFTINCGETTCVSEFGKFCPHCSWHPTTGYTSCDIFGALKNTKEDYTGWTLRHEKCLNAKKVCCGD